MGKVVAMDELSLIREGSFRVKISGRDVSNIFGICGNIQR